jgi:hypothetical protein
MTTLRKKENLLEKCNIYYYKNYNYVIFFQKINNTINYVL